MALTTLTTEQSQDGDNESYATAFDVQPEVITLNGARAMDLGASVGGPRGGDGGGSREELELPESSHSFLFTEPVASVPFVFGFAIATVSYACLALTLVHNWGWGSVPSNVELSVRIAQYLSIFITLLMEEELPTGLYLLRTISKASLKAKFPEISYPRFVCSSVLRMTMGYLFLINVLVIIVQAEGVIDIFYDCLALQFIQALDDIGFNVCRMEVLGKRLQRATMTPYFKASFQKGKGSMGLRWKVKVFLKAAYFINLVLFLSAMIIVSVRQTGGYYLVESITVEFGDEVWSDAIVQWPSHSRQYHPGSVEEMVLVYSYFNGVYAKDPSRTHEGRPIYVEQKKSDRTSFDNTTRRMYNPYFRGDVYMDSIQPAEIKYCGRRWTFSHDYIQMSNEHKPGETDCNWLARSSETDGFDLLDIDGRWQIWTDKIVETDISIRGNQCSDDSDCNLNGECNSEGKCVCDVGKGVVYLGTHCEVKLEDTCRTIIGEQYNDVWSVGAEVSEAVSTGASPLTDAPGGASQEYSRPVYYYAEGLPEDQAPREGDSLSLMYSGSRWFKITLQEAQHENAAEFWAWQNANYHAFWARAYQPDVTTLVSQPTKNDSPVGVDFYQVGRLGEQFGPFGLLISAQKDGMAGRGLYRCEEDGLCSFCSGRAIVDEDFVVIESGGYTCGNIVDYAPSRSKGSPDCEMVKQAEQLCCPPALPEGERVCSFCSGGTIVDEDRVVPESGSYTGGYTCGIIFDYASSLGENSSECQQIKVTEQMCCPP